MKVEHITAVTNHSVIRDTDPILLPTRHHFAGALPQGKTPVLIPGTSLSVMVTVAWPAAVFTLFKGEMPLLTNVCSFNSEGRKTALELAMDTLKHYPMTANAKQIPEPSIDTFLITIPIIPLATPQELMTAGEIELYLYWAIYERNHRGT